jgi:hypothetical protein
MNHQILMLFLFRFGSEEKSYLRKTKSYARNPCLFLRSNAFDGLLVQLSNTKDDTVTIVTTQRLPESTLDHAQLVVDRA